MGLATVAVDIAPIYERPSAESARLDEVLYGMSVQIIQESDTGWCYLRTEHRTEGYTPTACLLADANMATAWRKYKKMTVLAPYVDVQKAAEADAPRIASVTRGGILVALGTSGIDGWQKVGLANGGVGFTRASYLGEEITDWEALGEEDIRWNIVETALSYNGTAWRSGGRTPLGIDAAGLAAMSYAMNGIMIARQPFLKTGGLLHPIDQKQMDEGDLIYFHGSVGVYMGEGRFVHATDLAGGEGVVVSSLNPKDEDYRGDLAGHIVNIASIF